jgi:hypothetical protein
MIESALGLLLQYEKTRSLGTLDALQLTAAQSIPGENFIRGCPLVLNLSVLSYQLSVVCRE